jgi:hypothetical protein
MVPPVVSCNIRATIVTTTVTTTSTFIVIRIDECYRTKVTEKEYIDKQMNV